jgi:hypothetical protein
VSAVGLGSRPGDGRRFHRRVYRLQQRAGRLAVVASAQVSGQPSPALATTGPVGGRIVVAADKNLYVLRYADLSTRREAQSHEPAQGLRALLVGHDGAALGADRLLRHDARRHRIGDLHRPRRRRPAHPGPRHRPSRWPPPPSPRTRQCRLDVHARPGRRGGRSRRLRQHRGRLRLPPEHRCAAASPAARGQRVGLHAGSGRQRQVDERHAQLREPRRRSASATGGPRPTPIAATCGSTSRA